MTVFIFSKVVPARPTGPLLVTDVQKNSITIKWKPSADDGGAPITGYIVEKRPLSSKFWSKVTKVDSETMELCIRNLQAQSEYYFRVIAENKVGESQPLETADATVAKSPFSK